jgi:hypothetical protein
VNFERGRYASSEAELYEKAITLLEKCRIETRSSEQKISETTTEIPPIAV